LERWVPFTVFASTETTAVLLPCNAKPCHKLFTANEKLFTNYSSNNLHKQKNTEKVYPKKIIFMNDGWVTVHSPRENEGL